MKSSLLRLIWIVEKRENISTETVHTGNSDLIRPALEFIAAHYQEPVTVARLAETCNISTSHFMNRFKKTVGCSAVSYLNRIRIQKACSLLTDSSLPIAEIAGKCGFSNLANFNRQFRNITGTSPGEYRKR